MKRAVAILIAILAFVLFAYIAMDCEAITTGEKSMNVVDRKMVLDAKTPDSPAVDRAMVLEQREKSTPTYKYFNVPIGEDLQNHIFEVCESYNIHPAIVVSMIERESSYISSKVGDDGDSFGLMQIQPKWHQERMQRLDCRDLLDPYQNILVGVDYLAELRDRKLGMVWALTAYNGGPAYANQKRAEGVISDYVRDVIERGKELWQSRSYR